VALHLRRKLKPFICRDASFEQLDRPIFILSPPRSGSTWLFETLRNHPELWCHRFEAGEIWYDLFHAEGLHGFGDAVPESVVTESLAKALARDLYSEAILNPDIQRKFSHRFTAMIKTPAIRYLDKSIANCFRIPLLAKLFPDAKFVVLLRDPRPTVSSMIDGWGHPVVRLPQVDDWLQANLPLDSLDAIECARLKGEGWSYPVPDGWQTQLHHSIPEKCAWLWDQHVSAIFDALDAPDPAISSKQILNRTLTVHYEDMMRDQISVVKSILKFAELPEPAVTLTARDQALSRTTIAAPHPDKWRKNEAVLREIWPKVAGNAKRLGVTWN